MPELVQLESDSLLKSMPGDAIKAFRNSEYIWIEYCPDNTCDVIRTSAKVDAVAFGILASSYYFYFSRYLYLEQWQGDVERGKAVDAKLAALARKEKCSELVGRDLARCLLRDLERRSGLQIFFVRDDERARSRLRIQTKDALE